MDGEPVYGEGLLLRRFACLRDARSPCWIDSSVEGENSRELHPRSERCTAQRENCEGRIPGSRDAKSYKLPGRALITDRGHPVAGLCTTKTINTIK